jgi:adenosylcobyric acid synthase
MSDAGKSIVCAALCRIFKQDGLRAAPFKSQNMALNSYITRDGFEMGRAQVMQAEAAGIEPDVRMNPVLLKPSSDTGSQIIVLGEVRGDMSAMEYHNYKRELLPEVLKAFQDLAAENDVIVIEGAGSPAEINLTDNDIVNMGLASYLNAPVILVGDIDRGGVFAQLYGTAALMNHDDRARIEGMIINKFRGDVEILEPGLDMLEEKTGIPILGVIPMLHVDLDDEDSLSSRLTKNGGVSPIDIAVIRLPRLSNFTDFNALEMENLSSVRYMREVRDLGDPDLIIIPGTKSTIDDLLWMRQNGLESSILKHAAAGKPVLGVCGGYQMLGEQLFNPDHYEGKT